MNQDWQELTKITRGAALSVERVRLKDTGIAVEGSFELPHLARLTMEDQIFVVAFVRSHGSIKEMERLFGISYPTVKNRLNAIAAGRSPRHARQGRDLRRGSLEKNAR